MPEVDEKKRRIDWMGRPISSAQEAEQKRTTSYLYDMYHLGKNTRVMTDPNKRGEAMADLQKNLQAQYYGRKGLAEDYIKSDTDVTVEKSRGQTLRDVADISGRYQVEATKAGVTPPNTDLMSLAERLLGDKTDPTKIKLAGDRDEGPAKTTTLGLPDLDKKKKKEEEDVKRRLGVLKPQFGGEAVGGGLNFGIAKRLFKKPEDEDFFR